jgi:hypothetical protein
MSRDLAVVGRVAPRDPSVTGRRVACGPRRPRRDTLSSAVRESRMTSGSSWRMKAVLAATTIVTAVIARSVGTFVVASGDATVRIEQR